MRTLLSILVVLSLLATFGTMFAGVLGVGKEGQGARSNRLMRYRVLLQGLTLVLFMLLMMSMR
jgi:Hypoxia induced protein conserved region